MYRLLEMVDTLESWEPVPEDLKEEVEALLDRAINILKAQWDKYDSGLDDIYNETVANIAGKLLQVGVARELTPVLKEGVEAIKSKMRDLTAELIPMDEVLRVIGGGQRGR